MTRPGGDSAPRQQPGTGSVELVDGVRQTVLDSGVRVVTETMPDVRSVTVGAWIGVGSRDETTPVTGASHFLEHLLFKGTLRRSAKQIAEEIDAVGGDLNAFTTKEVTCFHAQTLDRDLPLAVDVLGDLMTTAQIRAEDVDAEREVVLEEIRMHLDTPDDLVHAVFDHALFGTHPLGREVLGTAQAIAEMPRDVVHGHYRDRYVGENLVVAAAGHVEHDVVVGEVARSLEQLRPTGPGLPDRHVFVPGPVPHVAVHPRPTEGSHVLLGGPGLPLGDERRYALSVLNQALGGGMASRLYQEVRERRGLAYSVFSYPTAYRGAGAFAVYAGTSPEKVTTVCDVLRTELDRLRTDGLDDDELARAKSSLTGAVVLSLEDTASRMIRLGKSVTTGTELKTLDQTIEAFSSVDHDDVRAVADLVLGGPLTLALVGPHPDLDPDDLQGYVAA